MRTGTTPILWLILATSFTAIVIAQQSRNINYQGFVKEQGKPYSGTTALAFSLYLDDPTGSSEECWESNPIDVEITNGHFTVDLSIPVTVFEPDGEYWLATCIGATCFDTLARISVVPEAIKSSYATSATTIRQSFSSEAVFGVDEQNNVTIGASASTEKITLEGALDLRGPFSNRAWYTGISDTIIYGLEEKVQTHICSVTVNTHGGTVIVMGKLLSHVGPDTTASTSNENHLFLYKNEELVDAWMHNPGSVVNFGGQASAIVMYAEQLPPGEYIFELRAAVSKGNYDSSRVATQNGTRLIVYEF